jgi:hypothetical protein
LNPIDQLTFMIGLAKLDFKPRGIGQSAATLLDIRQGIAAVDLGLSLAKQVEIGSIKYMNSATHKPLRIGDVLYQSRKCTN